MCFLAFVGLSGIFFLSPPLSPPSFLSSSFATRFVLLPLKPPNTTLCASVVLVREEERQYYSVVVQNGRRPAFVVFEGEERIIETPKSRD